MFEATTRPLSGDERERLERRCAELEHRVAAEEREQALLRRGAALGVLGFSGVFAAIAVVNLVVGSRPLTIFVAVIGAVAFAAIAWLAAWQTWLGSVFATLGAESTPALFEPLALVAIRAVLEHGSWSLSSSTDPVAGWPLAAAWAGELVFIVGFATLVASQRSHDRVYCEACGTWCSLVRDRARFDPDAGPALRASIVERGDFSVLESTAEAPRVEPWLALTLAFCSQCGETNAVAIHDVSPARGRKRGAGHEQLLYVPYHVVTQDRMRELRARAGA